MRTYEAKTNTAAAPDVFDGNHLNGTEAYSMMQELTGAVVSAGLTPANAAGAAEVFTQLSEAMSIYGGGGAEYMIDTGVVNAYVLNPVSPIQPPTAYYDGMIISFVPGTVNTAASTVNVNSIGVKDVVFEDSKSNLNAGELRNVVRLRYNASIGKFELWYTPVELQSLGANGFRALPKGRSGTQLYMQWGASAGLIAGQAVSFPQVYLTRMLVTLIADRALPPGVGVPSTHVVYFSNSDLTSLASRTGFVHISAFDADSAFWWSVGY